MENPEIAPPKYAQEIFDKVQKQLKWRMDSLSTKQAGTSGHPWVKNEP